MYKMIIIMSIMLNMFLVGIVFLEHKKHVRTIKSLEKKYKKTISEFNNRLLVYREFGQLYEIFHHDFRRDMPIILKNVQENNLCNAEALLRKLHKKCFLNIDRKFSEKAIIDTLIKERRHIINEGNIEVRTVLRHISFDFYGYVEIEQLLHALIDFALNKCLTSNLENKSIVIRTIQIRKGIELTIDFTTDCAPYKDYLDAEFSNLLDSDKVDCCLSYNEKHSTFCIKLFFKYEGFEIE